MEDKAMLIMDMPNACRDCPFLDDDGDYPKCIATHEIRGYNFRISELKMNKCPLKELPKDSIVLSREEYADLIESKRQLGCYIEDQKILLQRLNSPDPFWFCAFGGCEGACKECHDTCEMSIFVKERKKFYDKLNENICIFELENKSQEYVDGYTQAIADICGRLDKTAVELGVNIKE